MRHSGRRRGWAVALGSLLLATSCTNGGSEASAPETSSPTLRPDTGSSAGLFQVSLSAGAAGEAAALQLVDGDRLDDATTAAILGRLPAWDVPDESSDFNRPTASLGPPRVGTTVGTAFPPPVDVGPPVSSVDLPLEVVRFQPEGDLGLAPFVSVTFNQPMVALSTLEQLDQLEVPAEITPDVPGRWRWIGTRTLRFEVEPGRTDRLPMATNFTVRVPAGTVSASGAVLSEEVSWSFSTPPAVPTTLVPQSESLPLSPVFFLGFDQLVDPRAVLDATTVRAGDDDVAIRLATDKEVADDEAVAAASLRIGFGRMTTPAEIDAAASRLAAAASLQSRPLVQTSCRELIALCLNLLNLDETLTKE